MPEDSASSSQRTYQVKWAFLPVHMTASVFFMANSPEYLGLSGLPHLYATLAFYTIPSVGFVGGLIQDRGVTLELEPDDRPIELPLQAILGVYVFAFGGLAAIPRVPVALARATWNTLAWAFTPIGGEHDEQ